MSDPRERRGDGCVPPIPFPLRPAATPPPDALARIVATPRLGASRPAPERTRPAARAGRVHRAAARVRHRARRRHLGALLRRRRGEAAPGRRSAARSQFAAEPPLADRPAGVRRHRDRLRVHVAEAGAATVYMTPYVELPGFCAALAVAGQAGAGRLRQHRRGDRRRRRRVRPALGRPSRAGHARPPRPARALGCRRRRCGSPSRTARATTYRCTAAGSPTPSRASARRPATGPSSSSILRDGRVVRRRALEPVTFNTLAAARALVPASDGSRGQDGDQVASCSTSLDSQIPDGGAFASHTDLAATERVADARLRRGPAASRSTRRPSGGCAAGARRVDPRRPGRPRPCDPLRRRGADRPASFGAEPQRRGCPVPDDRTATTTSSSGACPRSASQHPRAHAPTGGEHPAKTFLGEQALDLDRLITRPHDAARRPHRARRGRRASSRPAACAAGR